MVLAQLIIEIIAFVIMISALFINIGYLENKKTVWHKFKVFAIAASFITFIFYFKSLAQYSFIFIIAALLTIEKKNQQNDKDSRQLGN